MNDTTPSRNIVLIGFMGSGKSTIGRVLQGMLGGELVDTDAVIEDRAGKAISAIFAEDGEAAFREHERTVLRDLAGQSDGPPRVIATGGGIVSHPENRELLGRLGYVVWLRVTPETVLARTRRSTTRPLLQTEDPAARIAELLAEREPWYREGAHLVLDIDDLDSDEAAGGILDSASYFFSTQTASPPCPEA